MRLGLRLGWGEYGSATRISVPSRQAGYSDSRPIPCPQKLCPENPFRSGSRLGLAFRSNLRVVMRSDRNAKAAVGSERLKAGGGGADSVARPGRHPPAPVLHEALAARAHGWRARARATALAFVSAADVRQTRKRINRAARGGNAPSFRTRPPVEVHTFGDGALRRTLATHTVPGPGGAQPLLHGPVPPACAEFQPAGDARVCRITGQALWFCSWPAAGGGGQVRSHFGSRQLCARPLLSLCWSSRCTGHTGG